MRRFYLKNELGDTYNLTDDTVLFHDVSGLGMSFTENYRNVGNRYRLLSRSYDQGKVSGSIAFYSENPYSQYNSFCLFATGGSLTLFYSLDGSDYFMRTVMLTSLEKSEITNYGCLDVSATFTAISPWFKTINVITASSSSTVKGWDWSEESPTNPDQDSDGAIKWDPTDTKELGVVTFKSSKTMSVIIDSDSNMDSPCKLVIYGPIKDPKWTHYVESETLATGKVSCTVNSGQRLEINNLGDTYTMKIINEADEEVSDVYQDSDFTTDRFISLKKGKNTIHVTSDTLGSDYVTIKAEAHIYYATV